MTSISEKTFGYTGGDIRGKEALEFAPVGILIFSKDFNVKHVNNNFFKFPGVVEGNPESLNGESIYENRIFANLDIRKDLDELKNLIAFERELTASKTLSGNRISILIKGAPIIINNKFEGGIIVLEDIKYRNEEQNLSVLYTPNFQNFLSQISDCFFFVDLEGNIKSTSIGGYEEYEFLFEPGNFIAGAKPQKLSGILFKKQLEQFENYNGTVWTEIPYLKKSKEQKAVITFIPIAEEEKTVLVLMRNVESKESHSLAEEEIKELRRYQNIVSDMLDAVIGVDNEGKINFWNESSAKVFGLTRSEVYGKFIGRIFPQVDQPFFEKLKQKIKEEATYKDIFHIGEDLSAAEYFSVNVGLLKGDDNDDSIIFLCSNITGKFKLEKELKESEEKFRNIIINSHDYICTLDTTGKITYANPQFINAFMYNEDEIIKLYFIDLIDSYYLMNTGFNINDIRDNKIKTLELPLTTKAGQRIYVLAGFSSAYITTETPQYYNVILTDITQKKESEKDLLLIRSLFEASHDGIALISKQRFFLVNDSCVSMLGYKSASDIIGKNPLDFVHENDLLRVASYMHSAEEGDDTPTRFDFTGLRKDSSTLELENSVSSYQTEEDKFIVWVLRDITEQKKAKAALEISEERYRSISENINQSFWTAERIDGKVKEVFYTPAVKNITGYSAEAFLEDPGLWKKIIHPDDVETIIKKIHNLYNDAVRNFEAFEYRIIDSLGNVIWIENKITVNRDSNGNILKVVGVVSDISLSKRAEEELKKSAMELKELNEAKDRFISIISHDLRTPFSSILGFTDFLLNEEDLDEEKREQYITFIQESAKSMLGLVNSLLDWTRLQTGRIKFEPERINAKVVVEKSIQIVKGTALQKNIKINSEIEKELFIHADENLLLQVLTNLLSNAIKFTKKDGSIIISANADVMKRQIQFSVKDDGVGIKKENVSKLFKVDAKYTTPGTAGERGSGLGLSLVRDIITKHGGDIRVESEEGKGSNFIFTIPVASTSILLVDDIKTDRILYAKLLKNLIPNYNILESENGKQALDIIKQSSPALVITDHKMPLMSGYDLVKQLSLSELKYNPPVIVLSSDINPVIEEQYKELGVEFTFQKPVNLSSFKNAIEKSLRKAVFN